jgi:hypothetical protein
MALANGKGSNEHPRKLGRDPLYCATGLLPVGCCQLPSAMSRKSKRQGRPVSGVARSGCRLPATPSASTTCAATCWASMAAYFIDRLYVQYTFHSQSSAGFVRFVKKKGGAYHAHNTQGRPLSVLIHITYPNWCYHMHRAHAWGSGPSGIRYVIYVYCLLLGQMAGI